VQQTLQLSLSREYVVDLLIWLSVFNVRVKGGVGL